MKVVLCKNCKYFMKLKNTNLAHTNFGDCENPMVEILEEWYPPKPSTRIIIKSKNEALFHVHRDFGCREGK